jgi:hypothetical protein
VSNQYIAFLRPNNKTLSIMLICGLMDTLVAEYLVISADFFFSLSLFLLHCRSSLFMKYLRFIYFALLKHFIMFCIDQWIACFRVNYNYFVPAFPQRNIQDNVSQQWVYWFMLNCLISYSAPLSCKHIIRMQNLGAFVYTSMYRGNRLYIYQIAILTLGMVPYNLFEIY